MSTATDRPFLTMAEMTATTGVSEHTLRYYEKAQLIGPILRTNQNQRRFRPQDVELVNALRKLRTVGMPIARMRSYAEVLRRPGDTVPEQLSLLEEQDTEISRQIAALAAHRDVLAGQLRDLRARVSNNALK